MSTTKLPIDQALPGVTLDPLELEPGERVDFVFVLARTKDADGDTAWSFRTSSPPNDEELLGALQVQVELLKRRLLAEWDVD